MNRCIRGGLQRKARPDAQKNISVFNVFETRTTEMLNNQFNFITKLSSLLLPHHLSDDLR